MLKRLKVWAFLAVATGAGLYQWGCGDLYQNVWFRVITGYLREDLFG